MHKLRSGTLLVTGFVVCPCHLPLTLGLLTGALAGTGVGSFIGSHVGLVYGIATGYFIGAVGIGLYLWSRKGRGKDAAGISRS
jgi:mercuric ion transport protein